MIDAATRARLDGLQRRSIVVGAAALAVCAIAGVFSPSQFFRSYLVAFLLWSGIPLGCLAVLMLHYLVAGGWGFLIRRPLESGTRTFPALALLAVPILLGIPFLYGWSHAEALAQDPLLRHKHVYLNVPFFVVRTIAYFVVWIGLAMALNRSADEQDRGDGSRTGRRLYALSGPGLVVYGVTVTFATVDWAMSLEPDWFSTIYSAIFMVGQALSALAFVTLILVLLISTTPLAEIASAQHLIDLGNMLLAFVILWAYLAFSQFLIIWSGNLDDEISWYVHRIRGGWQWIALLLAIGHFALPFLVLLSREVKQRAQYLAILGIWLLVVRFVDMVWNVDPAFDRSAFRFHWMDPAAAIGVGGLWIAAYLAQLKKRPILPLNDPDLPAVLAAASDSR
jgi:hypothetical protein